MRLVAIFAVVMLYAAAMRAQEPTSASSLEETLAWVRQVIVLDGGFTFTKNVPGMRTTTGKLNYSMRAGERCHLRWRTDVEGDEDVLRQFPQIDEDVDFKTILPNSMTIVPLVLENVMDTSGGTVTGFPAARRYWKVTAEYVYRPEDEQPFGLLFADEDMAFSLAKALGHLVDLCRGPQAKVPPGTGCDVIKVVNGDPAKDPPYSVGPGNQSEYHLQNRSSKVALQCMAYFAKEGSGKLDLKNARTIDIPPGGGYSGIPDIVPDTTVKALWCFEKDARDVYGAVCSLAAAPKE